MKKHTILKSIALFFSWLTLSPLLLILDGRWKLLPKWLRMLLFFLSPLMLIVFAAALIICYFYYHDYYYPQHHFVKPKVIENITGVKLPKYKVVEYQRRKQTFNRDYSDEFVLEFKDTPDDTFYQELQNKGFDCQDGCYYFHLNWGSGLVREEVVPKGEKGNYDYSMTICEGEREFTVRVMEL